MIEGYQAPTLFAIETPNYDPTLSLRERFEEFHVANPHVFEEIERRAQRLYQSNAKRIGIAQIFETMRYDYTIQTDGEDYKLNNSFRAFYARLLIRERPWLASRIETRAQSSEVVRI